MGNFSAARDLLLECSCFLLVVASIACTGGDPSEFTTFRSRPGKAQFAGLPERAHDGVTGGFRADSSGEGQSSGDSGPLPSALDLASASERGGARLPEEELLLEEDPCLDAPPGCCSQHSDCDDGDDATVDVCEGSTCVWSLMGQICTSDADCGDGDPCTFDACEQPLCEHYGLNGPGCCVASTQSIATFDEGTLDGLYVTDNLKTGVFWRVDTTRSTSGAYSLYCGDPWTQSYAAAERVKSSVTTPVVHVPSGGATAVLFDLFKDTRPMLHHDVLQIFVLKEGLLLPLWSSKSLPMGGTGGVFQSFVVSLSHFAGQSIQLRAVFDTVDIPDDAHEGVYLDDLRLETICAP